MIRIISLEYTLLSDIVSCFHNSVDSLFFQRIPFLDYFLICLHLNEKSILAYFKEHHYFEPEIPMTAKVFQG